MKLYIRRLAVAILLSLALPLTGLADIVILHTNDSHCGISRNLGFAKVAQYKKDLQKENPAVILVDAGDAIQGEPVGKLSQGASIVSLMNAVGYDFLIPGNHEFDYGMEQFLALAKKSEGGYYSANFVRLDTGKPVLPSYKMFEMDGKKVALIGVTTPETLVSSTPRFFKDEKGNWIYGFQEDEWGEKLYDSIQSVVDEARGKGAEYVFLVAHLGTNGAIPVWSGPAVIAHTTGIDGVIDGHSHEQYSRSLPNRDGKPVIQAQTGTKLERLGKITIHDDGRISSELLEKLHGEDPKVARMIREENEKVEKELAREIGVSAVDFVTDIDGKRRIRNGETNLGNLCADAIREEFHADAAFVNGGAIRDGLPKGKVTYKTLMTVYPFGNMMCLRQVTGQQILDALEVGASLYPEENGGFLHVSGMRYTIDPSIPSTVKLDAKGRFIGVSGKRRVKDVIIGGKPLDPREDYRIAGSTYLLKDGGNGMTMFEKSYLLRDGDLSDIETLVHLFRRHKGIIGRGYEKEEGSGRITISGE